MTATMQNISDAIYELKEKFSNDILKTIEFGTIPVVDASSSGQSTILISYALDNRGSLISVDHNIKSIEASKEVCQGRDNIIWIESDSVEYIKKSDEKFHFAFLDSHSDAETPFREFCLIIPKMITGGIIMVDDAGITEDGQNIDTNIPLCQKGHKIWQFLKDCNADFLILRYPTFLSGTQMKIILDEINIKKIIKALEGIEK